jgi:hypothetical protein
MSIAAAWFRIRNQKAFALLQGRVDVLRLGRRTQIGFYCLGQAMEKYRDLVRDHLDTLPLPERALTETELWPGVKALVEKVGKLADEGQAAGIIDEGMTHDLGMLGNSLLFVTAFTKLVVEPTSQNFNPRRR